MRVRFWGTRGSLAKPGPTTLRYGGDTSCVEVRSDNGTLIVLDCGTGAHGLGQALVAEGASRGHLLITHMHWDHIQGFPFFAPLFVPGNEWDVYAPQGIGTPLESALAGQMEYLHFPVTLDQLGAKVNYHGRTEGDFVIGEFRVTARYLNHPSPTLGYRLEAGGAVLVYATDHEPHSHHVHQLTNLPVHQEDLRHIEFLSGADLVIHDAQYTDEEYTSKVGWGHTSISKAVDFAMAANASRLALFHHDPSRHDDELDLQLRECRESVTARFGRLGLLIAAEGDTVELVEQKIMAPRVSTQQEPAPDAALPPSEDAVRGVMNPDEVTVLVADDDPEMVSLLVAALSPEGFRLLTASDGESALRVARAERPTLIVTDWDMPRRSGLELCCALRADADAKLRQVPVVLMTARHPGADDMAAAFAAGVTDYLTKPFTPQHVRSRVYTWLVRTHNAGTKDLSAEKDVGHVTECAGTDCPV